VVISGAVRTFCGCRRGGRLIRATGGGCVSERARRLRYKMTAGRNLLVHKGISPT